MVQIRKLFPKSAYVSHACFFLRLYSLPRVHDSVKYIRFTDQSLNSGKESEKGKDKNLRIVSESGLARQQHDRRMVHGLSLLPLPSVC